MGSDYVIDLNPDDFGEQSDALFHLGESYELAHGEIDGARWECRLANCGEQRLYDKEGNRIANDELSTLYDTDKKLSDAINKNEITIGNNSWWEVEFYLVDESSHWFLDLFTDNSEVIDSPKDAIRYVEFLLQDEPFIKDLKSALKEEGSTM